MNNLNPHEKIKRAYDLAFILGLFSYAPALWLYSHYGFWAGIGCVAAIYMVGRKMLTGQALEGTKW